MYKNKKISSKELCMVAMFIALTVILGYVSGFLRVGNISKISISFVPVYLSAITFNSVVGGFVALIADIVSYIVNPTGMFLWQLTVIEFIYGFLYGIIFKAKKESYLNLNIRILIFSLIQFIINMVAKTLILMSAGFVPKDFLTALLMRLPGCLVAAALNFVVINLLARFMPKLVSLVRK